MNVGAKIATGLLATTGISGGGFLILKNSSPKTLGEQLIYERYSLLNTQKDSEVDKSRWQEIIQKYESTNNHNKIGDLILKTSSDNQVNRDKNIKKLKEKCDELFNTSLQDEELSQKTKLAKNWCIKEAKGLTEALA